MPKANLRIYNDDLEKFYLGQEVLSRRLPVERLSGDANFEFCTIDELR